MKDMDTSATTTENEADIMSARFAQLVAQQSSMAMMLMGQTAHPETGQTIRDLEAARFFIDQLEMLELKTKGNLSPEEAALLKQGLMTLRMSFVEAVNAEPAKPPTAAAAPAAAAADGAKKPGPAAPAAPSPAPAENESHKKFTKKY
jgi:hypothetical protein